MQRFLFLTIDGLVTGAVYAVFALSLVLIWRAARVINFAQGAISVAAAYVGYTVADRVGNWWLGLLVAPVVGALLGVAIERTIMRRLESPAPGHAHGAPRGKQGPGHAHGAPRGERSHVDAVIVALGVLMVIQSVLGIVFDVRYRGVSTPVSERVLVLGGVSTTSPYRLLVLAALALLVAALALLFTRTRLGLRLRAAAFAPEVSRLFGVAVGRMTTVAWGLSAAAGAFAAMLVLPTGLGLHPTAMDGVFITAFTAAVLGGLDSAVGAVVGGVAVGLVLNYVTGYAGDPNLAPVAVLGLLLLVLLVRPAGLFARPSARRA